MTEEPDALATLVRAFDIQSGACEAFGSPFAGALLACASSAIGTNEVLTDLLQPWLGASARTLMSEAVPLRWLGCVHDLALSGDDEALTAAFPRPGCEGDAGRAWAAAAAAMAADRTRFAAFMTHEPQTNEVRRSACLLPGFLTLSAATGLPLRVFEVGASAGLNQLWDRYRYDYGPAGAWGDPASTVRIDSEWRGPVGPLTQQTEVASRAACDRKPVDLNDPAARRRLKAYVWADQFDRLARLEAAIDAALEAGVRVDTADAVAWTAAHAAPVAGAVTVLAHSVFWQYMPAQSQTDLAATIAGHGAAASAEAPFAWLRMEPQPRNLADMELRLTLWPGGEERLLAHVHPHGAFVAWGGAPSA